MTQPTTTTPLDDPATIDAIIAQVGAAQSGLGGEAGAIRMALRLANDLHVAPYGLFLAKRLLDVETERDAAVALRDLATAERDKARLDHGQAVLDRDIVVARLTDERDAATAMVVQLNDELSDALRERDEARAELAACRPSAVKDWRREATELKAAFDEAVRLSGFPVVEPRPILSAVEPEETP